jgi:hypothetical protein
MNKRAEPVSVFVAHAPRQLGNGGLVREITTKRERLEATSRERACAVACLIGIAINE